MKHEANHLEKEIKVMHWSDKQLSRKLCRGPTNSAHSTVTPEMLALLDSLMLPWAVDELEVQLLLAMAQTCAFVDYTVHLATFKVFCEDNESENDDGGGTEPIREITVNQADSSSSGEEFAENSKKIARQGDDDAGDDAGDDDQSRVDFEFTQNMASEFDRVMTNPLPCDLRFRYKKVRTVTVQLERLSEDNRLFPCTCSCGYSARIGLACRHILCFLIMIITKLIQKRDANGIFDWETFPVDFGQLVNMNICSKLKYHAVRHATCLNPNAASSCFSMNDDLEFMPKIPASVLRQFLGQFDVEDASKVPAPGVPTHGPPSRRSDQVNSNEHDDQATAASPRRASARSGSGHREPTEKGFMEYCQRVWDRTKRLKSNEATEARQILQQQMEIADELIQAIRPSRLPHKLTRYVIYW
jgi:hypothetical protein